MNVGFCLLGANHVKILLDVVFIPLGNFVGFEHRFGGFFIRLIHLFIGLADKPFLCRAFDDFLSGELSGVLEFEGFVFELDVGLCGIPKGGVVSGAVVAVFLLPECLGVGVLLALLLALLFRALLLGLLFRALLLGLLFRALLLGLLFRALLLGLLFRAL